MRRALVTLLIGLLAAPALWGGTVVQFHSRDLAQPDRAPQRGQMSVAGERLRIDLDTGGGPEPENSLIFHGDRQLLLAIDHGRKSYWEIDKATLSGVAEKMGAAMKQMEQALAQLPPEQRAQAEKILERSMSTPQAPAAAHKIELRPTAERAERQGYPCREVEMFEDGTLVRRLWVADWAALGVSPDTFAVLEGMGSFFAEALSSLQDSLPLLRGVEAPEIFHQLGDLGGLPVVTVELRDGQPARQTVLDSVAEDNLEAAAFEPPEGYREQSLGIP